MGMWERGSNENNSLNTQVILSNPVVSLLFKELHNLQDSSFRLNHHCWCHIIQDLNESDEKPFLMLYITIIWSLPSILEL